MTWLAATAASLVLLPWYTVEGSWWGASALLHGFQGRPWLLATFLPLIGALAARPWALQRERAGLVWILAGAAGVLLMLLQGFLFRHPNITPAGWPTQPGMGYGALLAGIGFLMMFCQGLAARGFCRGDAFVVSAIGLVVATTSPIAPTTNASPRQKPRAARPWQNIMRKPMPASSAP